MILTCYLAFYQNSFPVYLLEKLSFWMINGCLSIKLTILFQKRFTFLQSNSRWFKFGTGAQHIWLCEGLVGPHRDARVFVHHYAGSQIHVNLGCSSCIATAPNLTSMHPCVGAGPCLQAGCIWGPTLTWMSNWKQWLCLYSRCIPINRKGTACMRMHLMPVHSHAGKHGPRIGLCYSMPLWMRPY